MALVTFHKVTALPVILLPNALYFVDDNLSATVVITDDNGDPRPVVGAPTNLSFLRDTDSVEITPSNGTGVDVPAATALLAGVMAAVDKAKLDGIEAGATADLSGAEIVSLINGVFGSSDWQGAGGAMSSDRNTTVRVATTANITISTGLVPESIINGVELNAGDLVLVKNQTNPTQNGIYVSATTPVRAASFDTYDSFPGLLIVVQEGNVGADTAWLCTSDQGGTIGVSPIQFIDAVIAPTNISVTRDAITATIASSTGTSGAIAAATSSLAGVMSAADKTKLDGLGTNASRKFRAVKTGTQAVNTTAAKIIGWTETYDPSNRFDNVTNNRWTPGAEGFVNISVSARFQTTTNGNSVSSVILYKNGVEVMRSSATTALANVPVSAAISYQDVVTATDFFELFVIRSGNASTLQASSTIFSGHMFE